MTAVSPAKRRLFFALWPTDALRDEVRRAGKSMVRRCGGRPVAPVNYHITLSFLGNVPAEACDDVVAAAANISLQRFELWLTRFGYWSRARILWVAPAEIPTRFVRAQVF